MRAAIALLVLTACSADIPSMSYFCGADMLCPTDQVCDGSSNTCVSPIEATPFSCPTPIATQQLPTLACVSALQTVSSCLAGATDEADLVFDVPAGCNQVAVNVSVAFPIAFAPVVPSIVPDASTTPVPGTTTCTGPTGAGEARQCLTATLAAATRYHLLLAVDPNAADDCDGGCPFNRYDATLQLGTP